MAIETIFSFLRLLPAKRAFKKLIKMRQGIEDLGYTFNLKEKENQYIGDLHIYNFSKNKIRIVGVSDSRKISISKLIDKSEVDDHKSWIRIPPYLEDGDFAEVRFKINEDEDLKHTAVLILQVLNEGYITVSVDLSKKDEGKYKYLIQAGLKLPVYFDTFFQRSLRWVRWKWKEKQIVDCKNIENKKKHEV